MTATIGAEASYEYGDDRHFDDHDHDDFVNHEVTIMIIMMIMR